jgi:hypothetical protein
MRAAIVLALAAGCGAKAPSPEQPHNSSPAKSDPALTSKQALYDAAVAALRAKSSRPLAAAFPTVEIVEKNCPALQKQHDEMVADIAGAADKTQRYIDDCWVRGDLSAATLVEPRDESSSTEDGCPGSKSEKAKLVIRSGEVEVTARLGWVVVADGHIYLDTPPRCD